MSDEVKKTPPFVRKTSSANSKSEAPAPKESIRTEAVKTNGQSKYTAKDFASDQDIRWCPGCGDYSILAQIQRVMPELGVNIKDVVFIAGIGCSSRFPYYMNTYGVHGIHGRAAAIATGLKITRPELSVWVATGDGDSLSIGGNHFIHILRRNPDINILLFNNEIYGLTKGQYSPTSPLGQMTKSTPYGSIDYPFNPVALSLGASGTFVARTMDRDPKNLQMVVKRAAQHRGTSMIEIYQNCNIFNDGAFFTYTEKESKPLHSMFTEQGKPLLFNNGKKGIRLDGFTPRVVDMEKEKISPDDLWIHDERSQNKGMILAQMGYESGGEFPRAFGIFYEEDRFTYEDAMNAQIEDAKSKKGEGDIEKLLHSGETWVIK